ncbi:MAG: hypothetical protein NC086_05855 [Alistipes sp.]|nr:hypothetical protein [Alistipes sp.]
MIMLNALVNDIVFEILRFVLLGACMVAGVLVGKKLRASSNAKKTAKEEQQA